MWKKQKYVENNENIKSEERVQRLILQKSLRNYRELGYWTREKWTCQYPKHRVNVCQFESGLNDRNFHYFMCCTLDFWLFIPSFRSALPNLLLSPRNSDSPLPDPFQVISDLGAYWWVGPFVWVLNLCPSFPSIYSEHLIQLLPFLECFLSLLMVELHKVPAEKSSQ